MEELIPHLMAIVKKLKIDKDSKSAEIRIGSFVFNHLYQTLRLNKKVKKLTPTESDLIKLFAENKNETLECGVVLKKIWGDDSFFLTQEARMYS